MSVSPSEATPAPTAEIKPHRENVVRRLYRWVLHWADTPYGTPALAAISFAESSFFPIPPDVLQIALSVSRPRRSFYYAAVSAVASVVGGIAGWCIGYLFWAGLADFFFNYVPGFSTEVFTKVQLKYEENAFLAIFGAAFTPIPFKVFTIAAGVFNISLWTLIWASLLGRGMRFFAVATAIFFFGPQAKRMLETYFEIITFAMFLLLIAGFVAIKALH
ncbi:MAG: YqaA family protein [Planctomycetaceae bacterium]